MGAQPRQPKASRKVSPYVGIVFNHECAPAQHAAQSLALATLMRPAWASTGTVSDLRGVL